MDRSCENLSQFSMGVSFAFFFFNKWDLNLEGYSKEKC